MARANEHRRPARGRGRDQARPEGRAVPAGEALVYGLHAVAALLERARERVHEVILQEGRGDARIQALLERATAAGVAVTRRPRQELDEAWPEWNHQGALARCRESAPLGEQDLAELLRRVEQPLLLVLDGVQDPHNLGACLRTADAAGATAVVAPRDKATGLTPVVRKVACGAAETVPFVTVTNLARTLRGLREAGLWVVGTAGEAERDIYHTDLTGPLVLILGAEGRGLRRLTREHCDFLVSIPLRGSVSSLNVSVATGICLFEALRQRDAKTRVGAQG